LPAASLLGWIFVGLGAVFFLASCHNGDCILTAA
jgi:hypothetical protein